MRNVQAGRREQLASGAEAGGSCGFHSCLSHGIPTVPSAAGDGGGTGAEGAGFGDRHLPHGDQFTDTPRKLGDPKAQGSSFGSVSCSASSSLRARLCCPHPCDPAPNRADAVYSLSGPGLQTGVKSEPRS